MTDIKFYVPKSVEKKIIDLVEKHEGFNNQNTFIINCILFYENSKSNEKQQQQQKSNNDHNSELIQLISSVINKQKDDRSIVRSLDAKKVTPELITHMVWTFRASLVLLSRNKDIASVVNKVERDVVTKKDATSLRKYEYIMNICPDWIRRSIEQHERSERMRYKPPTVSSNQDMKQSKMPQFPEPPSLNSVDDSSEDDLLPYDENDEQQEPEEMDERDLIVR